MTYGTLIFFNFVAVLYLIELETTLKNKTSPAKPMNVMLLKNGRRQRWFKLYLILLLIVGAMCSTKAAREHEAPFFVAVFTILLDAIVLGLILRKNHLNSTHRKDKP